jgi:hypothetical protein
VEAAIDSREAIASGESRRLHRNSMILRTTGSGVR